MMLVGSVAALDWMTLIFENGGSWLDELIVVVTDWFVAVCSVRLTECVCPVVAMGSVPAGPVPERAALPGVEVTAP
jgi:hypothetical protein